ncbi:hypothetical protein J6590_042732 [Homalodisca vitripennis]|nr:hypothetical protein J6590_042732 [Homalodisca vitripennis]
MCHWEESFMSQEVWVKQYTNQRAVFRVNYIVVCRAGSGCNIVTSPNITSSEVYVHDTPVRKSSLNNVT